jgi:hypothetical protein
LKKQPEVTFSGKDVKIHRICRDSISAWIRKYARYPESYHPVSWGDYNHLMPGSRYIDTVNVLGRIVSCNYHGEVKPLRLYNILHTYELINANGDSVRYTHYFRLQYDYHIQEVDTMLGFRGYVIYPDDIQTWLKANGRELTPSDTADRFTPYRKALWALDFELDTVRDRWGWPGERKDTVVVKDIDSLYQVYFGLKP